MVILLSFQIYLIRFQPCATKCQLSRSYGFKKNANKMFCF